MRIGTVGTNFIVSAFAQAVALTGEAEIAVCYSRNRETGESFAQKNAIPSVCCDRQAFLQDSSLDFVYIASPNSLHYAWAYDALSAGRNVICEKPFVSTKRELEALIALAKDNGLFLFEALTIPHLPNYKLLQAQLHAIGTPRLAILNFSQYSSRYAAFLRGENPNAFSPEFSGGALMDLNYYNLNFMVGLFGAPNTATYYPNLAENGIDTSGVLVLDYGGFVATLHACKDNKGQNFVQIQGENGYVYAPTVSSTLSEGFTVYADGEARSFNEQTEENVLYYELNDFISIYKAGDRSVCDTMLAQSLLVAGLMETTRKEAGIYFAADNL